MDKTTMDDSRCEIAVREKPDEYKVLLVKAVAAAHPGEWEKILKKEPRTDRRRQKQLRLLKQAKESWMQEKIKNLRDQLFPHIQGAGTVYTVYDPSVKSWLKGEDCLEEWIANWPYPLFDGYHELLYAKDLLSQSHASHYLVLGYDRCVPDLIISRVRHMKSLRLILDYLPRELEDFLEDLYEEYGLAATYKILPYGQEAPYRAERIASTVPTVVLDFTREDRILPQDIYKGSVWLDMDSMEEKRKRMEERAKGVIYVSLLTQWRQGLDTLGQNGYNTRVN